MKNLVRKIGVGAISTLGWIFLAISSTTSFLCILLLIYEAVEHSYDCKSQSTIGIALLFFGVFLAIIGAALLLSARHIQKYPLKRFICFFSILIGIQIFGLAMDEYLAHHLKEDCAKWENG